MQKRKQMEQIIERGSSIVFNGKLISRISELPSEAEIERHYANQARSLDFSWMGGKYGLGGGSSPRQPLPQMPVMWVPPSDDEIAAKFPYTDEFGLGRLAQVPDVRDSLFPMEAKLTTPILKEIREVRYRYWSTEDAMDQGDTPHCVSYSRTQLLLSGPVKNKAFMPILDFYNLCQRLDEWPGEAYDGTSVRAMCKGMMQEGHITGYTWATDVETAIKHVLGIGPIVLGTNWSNSMFYPDAITSFIKYDTRSGIAGGHAYLVVGANRDKLCPDGSKGAFRILNSWGESWGDNGRAFLSFADAARLIRDYGECAGVNEIKFTPAAEG